jgi:hypothetical protein
MAEEVGIQGTEATGKLRNPLGIVGLALVTLGIYYLFWYFYVNKEMAEIGRARNTEECGTKPGTSLLAVTLGILIIVPPFVSIYKAWKRLTASEQVTGTAPGMEAGLGFLLSVFIGPVGMYIFQSNMNKVLQQQAAGAAPAAPTPPAPEQP